MTDPTAANIRFHVLTVFPEMILGATKFGVVGQALDAGKIAVAAISPRAFTSNVHQTIDDRPFGGGDGMIMLSEPMAAALESLKMGPQRRVIHLSPRGRPFTDEKARELAHEKELVLIASRYGGIDQRFINEYVDEELSIGDYVISGGELAALVVIDAVARLIPGVLGNARSSEDESFASPTEPRLEAPQFTRPREWRGIGIPEALLSGHHTQIETWKRALSTLVTLEHRPELLVGVSFEELDRARKVLLTMSLKDRELCGLSEKIEKELERVLEKKTEERPKGAR